MGNSLQDVITFGRRAGIAAAKYVNGGVAQGKLTLDHIAKFEKELVDACITDSIIAPILLPDYSTDEVSAPASGRSQAGKRISSRFTLSKSAGWFPRRTGCGAARSEF